MSRARTLPSPTVVVAGTLAVLFAGLMRVSWFRWGHVRIDAGGALDRAARIAQGDVLYRDVLSPYGPLPDYAVAAAFRVFGIRLEVAYAIGAVLVVLESVLLWRVTARFLSPVERAVGLAMFWVLFAFAPGPFGWILPNLFASTFGAVTATAALLLAIRAREDAGVVPLVAASLVGAMAGLSKVEFGLAAAVTVVAAAWLRRQGRRRALAAAVLPGLALACVVAGVFLLVVPWETLVYDNLYRVRSLRQTVPALGAVVPSMSLVGREFVLRYAIELTARAVAVAAGLTLAARSGARRGLGAAVVLAALVVPAMPAYTLPVDFLLDASARGFTWTPAVWAVSLLVVAPRAIRGDPAATAIALAAVWSLALAIRWQGRLLWPSYYGVISPFLVVLAVGRLAALVSSRHGRTAAAAVVATVVAAAGVAHTRHFTEYYVFPLSYPRGEMRTVPFEGRPLARVIDYVRDRTEPGEYVVSLPEERLINFLAERRHPTRDPGTGPGWLATAEDEDRFIREVDGRPTCLIVVSERRYPELGAKTFATYAPRVMDWLRAHWEPAFATDERLVNYTVYRPRHAGRTRCTRLDDHAGATGVAPTAYELVLRDVMGGG